MCLSTCTVSATAITSPPLSSMNPLRVAPDALLVFFVLYALNSSPKVEPANFFLLILIADCLYSLSNALVSLFNSFSISPLATRDLNAVSVSETLSNLLLAACVRLEIKLPLLSCSFKLPPS